MAAITTALIVAIIGCVSSNRAASPPAIATAQIDRLFAAYNTPQSPGCSVGVSRNGATIYERG